MRKPAFPTRFFNRIFDMGLEAGMDVRKAKRIVLSNQISISVAILNLPYVLIYPFMGKGALGWMEIPLFLGYASVHRWNGAGRTLFSRWFLVVLANLDILTYSLALGRNTGMHFLFLPACWAPLALFDWENRKSLLFAAGFSSLLLLGVEAFGPMHGLDPLSPESERHLHLLTVATAVLVQCLFAAYFFRANQGTEAALAQAGQDAQAADKAKGDFLASMSGEIRTPLQTILGASKTLMKSGLGPDHLETLQDIHSSAADLSGIVGEILDMSQIEAGAMKLDRAAFPLTALAHSVLRPFEYEAGSRGIEMVLEIGDTVPGLVLGDAARLKQVLRNLLGNAVKFTDRGRITLRIDSNTKDTLGFEVEDTGIGIPAHAQGRIFEPFFQADSSASRKYGGTGLGLFISKQIVEMMGGKLAFRSAAGGGTVFHFLAGFPEARTAEASPDGAASGAAVETTAS